MSFERPGLIVQGVECSGRRLEGKEGKEGKVSEAKKRRGKGNPGG
jgi:hypothetical protein